MSNAHIVQSLQMSAAVLPTREAERNQGVLNGAASLGGRSTWERRLGVCTGAPAHCTDRGDRGVIVEISNEYQMLRAKRLKRGAPVYEPGQFRWRWVSAQI